jgi:hypothetical protein
MSLDDALSDKIDFWLPESMPSLSTEGAPKSRDQRRRQNFRVGVDLLCDQIKTVLNDANSARRSGLDNKLVTSLLNSFASRSSAASAKGSVDSNDFASQQISSNAVSQRLAQFVHSRADRYLRRLRASIRSSVGEATTAVPPTLPGVGLSNPYASHTQTPPLRIVASKLSLPTARPTIPVLDRVRPAVAARYADVANVLVPEHLRQPAPRTTVHASREQYLETIRKLYALGLVEFTQRPKAINGLFAVKKDGDQQRLILDARPANVCFVEPPSPRLPTPAEVSNLRTDDAVPIYAAKVDLRCFFQQLLLPASYRPYFCLPAVTFAELGLTGPGGDWFPMMTTVPMGWSHSVFLAQDAHEYSIESKVGFDRSKQIVASNADVFLRDYKWLVYVDDLVLIGHDPGLLRRLQDSYIEAIDFIVHAGKVVRPCRHAEILGLELDGVEHTFGLAPRKLERLRLETTALLSNSSATGREVAALVGAWIWASLVCRPALSLLSTVFRFARVADARRFEIWPSVRRELAQIAALAPLLVTRLAAPFSSFVLATDASSVGQGLVRARAPVPAIESAATWQGRHSLPLPEQKLSSQLPPQQQPQQLLLPPVPGGQQQSQQSLLQQQQPKPPELRSMRGPAAAAIVPWVRSLNWRTLVASAWRSPAHINTLELQAVLTAFRWSLSLPGSIDHRFLLLCDSSVVAAALAKGRSSAPSLQRHLQRFAALTLASGIRFCPVWLASESNPADEASRRFSARSVLSSAFDSLR